MAIKANVHFNRKSSIPPKCFNCKGTCFVPGNNKKTQENAHKMFGPIIPDKCVQYENDNPACPAALGYLK